MSQTEQTREIVDAYSAAWMAGISKRPGRSSMMN